MNKFNVEIDSSGARQILQFVMDVDTPLPEDWHKHPSYSLALEHAKRYGLEFDRDSFNNTLVGIKDKRKNPKYRERMNGYLSFLDSIIAEKDSSINQARKVIFEYLPPKTSISAKVYLAVFQPQYAFTLDTDVVLNIAHSFFDASIPKLFILVTHELYHVGFSQHQKDALPESECKNRQELAQNIAWQIQNEGMATYVASYVWKTNPQVHIHDYELLSDLSSIGEAFSNLRELLNMLRTGDVLSIRKSIWDIGVEERVFYVTGAHIAQVIEEKLGKPRLIQTVLHGPQDFIEVFLKVEQDHRFRFLIPLLEDIK